MNLLDPGLNRRGAIRADATLTSRDAGLRVATGQQCLRVLEAIKAANRSGLTDEEIGQMTGISMNAVRPRRGWLVDNRWVEYAGFDRPTVSGRSAMVWVLTEEAVDYFLD